MKAPRWTLFRGTLAVSAAWFTGYAVYRYSLFNPPEHGTVYGTIFPAALLLAAAGFLMAARPAALGRRRGAAAGGLKVGLTGLGFVWMATGLHCTLSLMEGIAAAPLGGSVDMVHMLSDHVFLPASVAMLAWAPDRLARRLGARSAEGRGAAPPLTGLAPGAGSA